MPAGTYLIFEQPQQVRVRFVYVTFIEPGLRPALSVELVEATYQRTMRHMRG